MPRNYVRRKIKTYTPQDLAEAIQKIKDGELTQYSAAKLFKIPLTTIHDNLKQNTISSKAGRPIVIPLEDEKKLAEVIAVMEKWGFGLSRYEIMEIVADYVRINKIKTPFKNNIPGPDWFINFRKRHRLSVKKAQPVEYVRRKMTDPFVIAEYFDLLETTLKDLNILQQPQAIWNLDETSISLDPSRTKVVGQINKPCARTTHGSGKENITVLTGASASGIKLPPLIVFKGKFIWDQWMAELDPAKYDFELSYSASKNGWMETDIFYNYVDKILIPNLGDDRPVLVIYDGHSTHVDVRVIQLAIQNQVTIIKLPPHTSHLLQPMDISVFKSFKTLWDAKLVDWQRRNVGTKMPKKIFAQALADTWQQTNPEIIKTGFKKAGIYPFNAQVIPVDKYDPDAYKRYQKKVEERLAHIQLNPKHPKRLKDICIDWFNNLPTTHNSYKRSDSNNVLFLSQISKTDPQRLRFIAEYPSEIPFCLRNSMPIQNQTLQSPKRVIITSNEVIKRAPQPALNSLPQVQQSCTFEELILRKIQQDKKDTTSTKKKRITKGAEVITATMGKKILEETEKSKNASEMKVLRKTSYEKEKSKKVNKKANLVQENLPSTSGLKHKNKRKRKPSFDSTTSTSDIMSEHSDSDIVDVGEQFSGEFEEEISVIGIKRRKTVPIYENVKNKKLLCIQNLNILSNKGKGVGKKSKGKENEIILKDKQEVNESIEGKGEKVAENNEQMPLENKYSLPEIYKVNDSVLVRYYIRNKWKYYIGLIEEIINDQNINFTINFLKTKKKQQQLSFIMTKKKDSDKIPETLIVKKIDLKNKDDKKEFYLCNDDDTVYFD